jgi:hypothetical protein
VTRCAEAGHCAIARILQRQILPLRLPSHQSCQNENKNCLSHPSDTFQEYEDYSDGRNKSASVGTFLAIDSP